MKELINFLLQSGNLNQQQINLITNKAKELEIKKDAYFVEAGKTFNHVAFISEGVLRICFYNNKGEEITKYFTYENHFLANPYNHETISEYIQAVTDCKLFVFSKNDWAELSNTIVVWKDLTDKIFQKALVEKLDRRSALVSQDAKTRYLTFLEKFPTLANRVPLSYIACYLGMTQQSLSRIRKNIR